MIIKVKVSNMVKNIAIHCLPVLQSHLINIIGETVERQDTRVKRIAAKQIIKLDSILYYPKDGQDLMMSMLEIAELNYRLASPWTYFCGELEREPEPYSADGMLFHALVHLARIEEGLLIWEWHLERIRALGLEISPGEEIAWPITRDFVSIMDREGKLRRFHRFSS